MVRVATFLMVAALFVDAYGWQRLAAVVTAAVCIEFLGWLVLSSLARREP